MSSIRDKREALRNPSAKQKKLRIRQHADSKSKTPMKLTSLKSLSLALVAGTALTAIAPAQAQNTAHSPASIILTFQNPGGSIGATQTITVALNDAAFFRDAALGTFSSINVTNLGATLSSTFGSTWYDQSTLWMGAVGSRGANAITLNNLLQGDPQQTHYISRFRDGVGTVGLANSTQPTVNSGGNQPVTSGINQVKGTLEAASGSVPILVNPTSSSFIDENNPFTAPGVQNAAYGSGIAGGVQGNFGAGSYGSFGGAGNIELAIDLYRVQYRNDITSATSGNPSGADQYGLGEDINRGKYLGTITINQNGDLGYVTAVPEPATTAVIVAACLAGLVAFRRYRSLKA